MLDPLTEIVHQHPIVGAVVVVMALTLLVEVTVRLRLHRPDPWQGPLRPLPALASSDLATYWEQRQYAVRIDAQRRVDREFRRIVEAFGRED